MFFIPDGKTKGLASIATKVLIFFNFYISTMQHYKNIGWLNYN